MIARNQRAKEFNLTESFAVRVLSQTNYIRLADQLREKKRTCNNFGVIVLQRKDTGEWIGVLGYRCNSVPDSSLALYDCTLEEMLTIMRKVQVRTMFERLHSPAKAVKIHKEFLKFKKAIKELQSGKEMEV